MEVYKMALDIISTNSTRISRNLFNNEVIAIDLDTYQKIKIKFLTEESSCDMILKYLDKKENIIKSLLDPSRRVSSNYPFSKGMEGWLKREGNIIPSKDGTWISIEDLD